MPAAGWLFYNQNYFARPDIPAGPSFGASRISISICIVTGPLFGDVNMFTDRSASNVACPSELDWIIGIALRWHDLELSLYRKQDRPLDRGGFVQAYWAVQVRFPFDVPKRQSQPFEHALGARTPLDPRTRKVHS